MARKKKKKTSKPKQPAAPTKFAVGDRVRVKRGVMDYDFPDIPLGGWAGVVEKIEKRRPPVYLVQWNQQTLEGVHPIYKNRCERDGLDYEKMGLNEEDLEPDEGGPVEIEQPTQIVTPPLDLEDEDDRIRAVFQLTRDDPVPEVDFETLKVYRDYLAEHLTFPFKVIWEPDEGPFSSRRHTVTVLSLGEAEETYRIDDMYGLICEIKADKQRGDAPLCELEIKKRDQNRQLVSDYSYWFTNYG